MNDEELIKSIVNLTLTEEKLSEEEMRGIVGAPSIEEAKICDCGKQIKDCKDSYEHMTQGY